MEIRGQAEARASSACSFKGVRVRVRARVRVRVRVRVRARVRVGGWVRDGGWRLALGLG